jgi:hypothetical protein
VRRPYSSALTLAALSVIVWQIWTRLHLVILVTVPWWGLLIGMLVLFIVFDYLLHKVFGCQ